MFKTPQMQLLRNGPLRTTVQSEALGLCRKDAPLGDWLTITGKGDKMRDVPVLKAASEAVDDYLGDCPFDDGAQAPLFVSSRGKPLGARAVQRLLEGLRVELDLPSHVTPRASNQVPCQHTPVSTPSQALIVRGVADISSCSR